MQSVWVMVKNARLYTEVTHGDDGMQLNIQVVVIKNNNYTMSWKPKEGIKLENIRIP